MKNISNYSRREFLASSMIAIAGISTSSCLAMSTKQTKRPNILWITSEDNSPLLGCYGDSFATTPNLDNFAKTSVLYKNASANAPVCAPARFTILTGMYACSTGTHHMRSRYPIPALVKPYTKYLRDAGYYCTNKSKTDYNYFTNDIDHWDECSKKASYRNCPKGQPFFSVINVGTSHESSIHRKSSSVKHDPAKVTLPPYHPDTPEIRKDWAQYYDKVQKMDAIVGKILKQLEKDSLLEDTIVFYYADHGGVLCRSKRFLYNTGTHVPMIIRFPKKYQYLSNNAPGTKSSRIVSFVDLAPTILSLAGIKIPEYMQGEAWLGSQQKQPRKYSFMFRGRMDERYDMMRVADNGKYRYIRNYMPHRIYGQHLEYLWKAAATKSWEKEFKASRCNKAQSLFWQKKPAEELYDISKDPWEVNNLSENKEYADTLFTMRKEVSKWVRDIKDSGFIPEGMMIERSKGSTAYELVRSKDFPIDRIIETAEMATSFDDSKLSEIIKRLKDTDSAVRYWAAVGCTILADKANQAIGQLLEMLEDQSCDVRIAAAEALCQLGKPKLAIKTLVDQLQNDNIMISLRAANTLDITGPLAKDALPIMKTIRDKSDNKYIIRAINHTVSRFE